MEKFLKNYSAIPHEFIDDFYAITNEDYDNNSLCIDFDIVAAWLNVRKNNLKRILVANFDEKHDYVIEEVEQQHVFVPGSSFIEIITITPFCFKQICMISQTSNARKVRDYYIALEDLVKKYHYDLEKKMNEKIKMLEANQRPKLDIKGGVIYFREAFNFVELPTDDPDEEWIKMGKTDNTLNRFNTYNSGNVNDGKILFHIKVDNVAQIENCVKNLAKKYQYRDGKEIYKINIDILKEIVYGCDSLQRSIKYLIETYEHDKAANKIINKKFKNLRHAENGFFLEIEKNI